MTHKVCSKSCFILAGGESTLCLYLSSDYQYAYCTKLIYRLPVICIASPPCGSMESVEIVLSRSPCHTSIPSSTFCTVCCLLLSFRSCTMLCIPPALFQRKVGRKEHGECGYCEFLNSSFPYPSSGTVFVGCSATVFSLAGFILSQVLKSFPRFSYLITSWAMVGKKNFEHWEYFSEQNSLAILFHCMSVISCGLTCSFVVQIFSSTNCLFTALTVPCVWNPSGLLLVTFCSTHIAYCVWIYHPSWLL